MGDRKFLPEEMIHVSGDKTKFNAGPVKVRFSEIGNGALRTVRKHLKYTQATQTAEIQNFFIQNLPHF